MRVRIIRDLLLLGIVFGIAEGFLEAIDFQTVIARRCYNETSDRKRLVNGQSVPSSSSMETFIGFLESFERNYTYSQVEILELFLSRFRIDGIIEESEKFRQRLKDRDRLKLINDLLKPSKILKDFPENAFTEDEKCALYYMMSHTIVKNSKQDQQDSLIDIEQGVVTLNNNPKHSIALGKVLLGILAGLKGGSERSVQDVISSVEAKVIEFPREPIQLSGNIDPLYGVTIGDTIASEVLRIGNETLKKMFRKFGPNGVWNSTICPTKYKLIGQITDATYGEIRGAGDGFILGKKAREIMKLNPKLSLSMFLRMFYSSRGILKSYTYCNRWNNWGEFNDKAQEQIHHYSRLMNILIAGGSFTDKELLDGARGAISEFSHSKDDIVNVGIPSDQCFHDDTKANCETPSDVFVVLDNRGNEPNYWQRQKEVITLLATNIDLNYYRGRFHILANSRGYGDRVLETLRFNETSEACIGCKLEWYISDGSNVDETYVLESLHKLLTNYESDRSHSPSVPGKSIIYFNFGDSIKNDRNFKNAYWDIDNKHRDVQIFSIGSNRKVLEYLATDKEKALIEDSVAELVKYLTDEICESPGIIQYPDCYKKPSSFEEFIFQGYVTPNGIQYWSMFPEFFLKSYDIKFQFTSEDGNIRVCYTRDKRRMHTAPCQETSSQDPVVNFYISNPCKGKTVYNCAPFHFSIEGITEAEPKCSAKECKTFDQIKFKIQHEGVSCNGSTQLISSFILVALALFYLTKMNK